MPDLSTRRRLEKQDARDFHGDGLLVPYVLHGRREGAEVAAPALRVPVGDREVVLPVEEAEMDSAELQYKISSKYWQPGTPWPSSERGWGCPPADARAGWLRIQAVLTEVSLRGSPWFLLGVKMASPRGRGTCRRKSQKCRRRCLAVLSRGQAAFFAGRPDAPRAG